VLHAPSWHQCLGSSCTGRCASPCWAVPSTTDAPLQHTPSKWPAPEKTALIMHLTTVSYICIMPLCRFLHCRLVESPAPKSCCMQLRQCHAALQSPRHYQICSAQLHHTRQGVGGCIAVQGMCNDKVRRGACYWSDIIYHVLYMLLLLQSELSMFLSGL